MQPVQKLIKIEYRNFQNRMQKLSKYDAEAFKIEEAKRIEKKETCTKAFKNRIQKLSK